MAINTPPIDAALPRLRAGADEKRTLLAVSGAHLISHFHLMVLPVLLPLLKERLGVPYFDLALALTAFSVATGLTQAPLGFLVDRLGARPMLRGGLTLAGLAFLSIGLLPSYPLLLIAAVMAGLANAVYHPADYALLLKTIAEPRIGRAFSLHIFAGFLGGAIAPPVLLALAAVGGLESALIVSGLMALAAALALSMLPVLPLRPEPRLAHAASVGARRGGLAGLLTPAVLSLTAFFTLLALAGSAMSNFSAVALIAANGVSLIAANAALTAYLTGAAAGVLLGGTLADRSRRHGRVAAIGFLLSAAILLGIATLPLEPAALGLAMGLSGLLYGLIQPSRDMLVRKAAPREAAGRVFGIVSTGFNIGGFVGPLLFGWLMDAGRPRLIFLAAVIFMTITAIFGLLEERRSRPDR
jgi:MFS family permease